MYQFSEEELKSIEDFEGSLGKRTQETKAPEEDRYSSPDVFGKRKSSLKQRFMRFMEVNENARPNESYEQRQERERKEHPYLQPEFLSNLPQKAGGALMDVGAASVKALGATPVSMAENILGRLVGKEIYERENERRVETSTHIAEELAKLGIDPRLSGGVPLVVSSKAPWDIAVEEENKAIREKMRELKKSMDYAKDTMLLQGLTTPSDAQFDDYAQMNKRYKTLQNEIKPTPKQEFIAHVGNDIAEKTMEYADYFVRKNAVTEATENFWNTLFHPISTAGDYVESLFSKDSPHFAYFARLGTEVAVLGGAVKTGRALAEGGKTAYQEAVRKNPEKPFSAFRSSARDVTKTIKDSVSDALSDIFGKDTITEKDFENIERRFAETETLWKNTKGVERTTPRIKGVDESSMVDEYFKDLKEEIRVFKKKVLSQQVPDMKGVSERERVQGLRDALKRTEKPQEVRSQPEAPRRMGTREIPEELRKEYEQNVRERLMEEERLKLQEEEKPVEEKPVETQPEIKEEPRVEPKTEEVKMEESKVEQPKPEVLKRIEEPKVETKTEPEKVEPKKTEVKEESTAVKTVYVDAETASRLTSPSKVRTQVLHSPLGLTQYALLNGKWKKTRNSDMRVSETPGEGLVPLELHNGVVSKKTGNTTYGKAQLKEGTSFQNEKNYSLEDVRKAYADLKGGNLSSDVLIADIQEHSGIPLGRLHELIREGSRKGDVIATEGDWSLSDTRERAAAVEIRGKPNTYVKFRDVGGDTLVHSDIAGTPIKAMTVDKTGKVDVKRQRDIPPEFAEDVKAFEKAERYEEAPQMFREIFEKDAEVSGSLLDTLMDVESIAALYAKLGKILEKKPLSVRTIQQAIKKTVEKELRVHEAVVSKQLDGVLDSLKVSDVIRKAVKEDYLECKTPKFKKRDDQALFEESLEKTQAALDLNSEFQEYYERFLDLDSFVGGEDFLNNVQTMAARNLLVRYGGGKIPEGLKKHILDNLERNPKAVKDFRFMQEFEKRVEIAEEQAMRERRMLYDEERATATKENLDRDIAETLENIRQHKDIEAPPYWRGTVSDWKKFASDIPVEDRPAYFTMAQEYKFRNIEHLRGIMAVENFERLLEERPAFEGSESYALESDALDIIRAEKEAGKVVSSSIKDVIKYDTVVAAFRKGFLIALKDSLTPKETLELITEMNKDLFKGLDNTFHMGLGHWKFAQKLVETALSADIDLAKYIKTNLKNPEGGEYTNGQARKLARDYMDTYNTYQNIKEPVLTFCEEGDTIVNLKEQQKWAEAVAVKAELRVKQKELKGARAEKRKDTAELRAEIKALSKQWKKFPKKLRREKRPAAFGLSEAKGMMSVNPVYEKPWITKDYLTPKVFIYEGLLGKFGTRLWHSFMRAEKSERHFTQLITKYVTKEARKLRLSDKSLENVGNYMTSLQKGGAEALVKAGKKIVTAEDLTAPEKAFAVVVRNWFDSLLEEAENAHYAYTGGRLVVRENYFHVLGQMSDFFTQDMSAWSQSTGAIEMMRRSMSKAPTPGFVKSTTKINRAGELNALTVTARYADALAHYKYSTPIFDRGLQLINRAWDLNEFHFEEANTLRQEMLAKGIKPDKKGRLMWKMNEQRPEAYKALHEAMVQGYSRRLNGYDPENVWHRTLYNLSNDVAASTLSLSASSFINQLGSIPDIIAGTSLATLSKAVVRAFANDRAYTTSDVFEKYSVSFDEACYSFLLNKGVKSTKQAILSQTLRPMQMLDGFVRKVAWEAGYEHYMEKIGKSEAEAIRYADAFVVKSQSHSNFVNRPALQADFLGKVITPMQSFSINQWSYITRTLVGTHGYRKPVFKEGIIQGEATNPVPVRRVVRNLAAGIFANAIMGLAYNYVLDMHAPNPDPIGAYINGVIRTDKHSEAMYDSLVEILGTHPVFGNLKFISGDRKHYALGAGIGTGIDALRATVSIPEMYARYKRKGMSAEDAFYKTLGSRDTSALFKSFGVPLGKQFPATVRNWGDPLHAVTGQSFKRGEEYRKKHKTMLQSLSGEEPPRKRGSHRRKKRAYSN